MEKLFSNFVSATQGEYFLFQAASAAFLLLPNGIQSARCGFAHLFSAELITKVTLRPINNTNFVDLFALNMQSNPTEARLTVELDSHRCCHLNKWWRSSPECQVKHKSSGFFSARVKLLKKFCSDELEVVLGFWEDWSWSKNSEGSNPSKL